MAEVGDLEDALKDHEEARSLAEEHGFLESSLGADILVNLGIAKASEGYGHKLLTLNRYESVNHREPKPHLNHCQPDDMWTILIHEHLCFDHYQPDNVLSNNMILIIYEACSGIMC